MAVVCLTVHEFQGNNDFPGGGLQEFTRGEKKKKVWCPKCREHRRLLYGRS